MTTSDTSAEPGQDLESRLRAETDLLSVGAGFFRSKMISDFQLLDSITESGCKLEPPKYYTNDLTEKDRLKKIMKVPHSLVRFQVYSNKSEKSVIDRRNNRVKNRNSKNPPLDLWAHWVVESSLFQNFILALILLNCIVLGIQGEVMEMKSESVVPLKIALDVFDYCAMAVYLLEILLKWMDNFWLFWKNRWNIFDFVITFTFVVPEIISFSTGDWGKESSRSPLTVIANNLRTFRILRSLKMVSRFQKVRLIVLAVTKAFQAMVFITVLLIVFAYIFAIIGVMFFRDKYIENPNNATLYYPSSFTDLHHALITLFQLLTLDHWIDVYRDLVNVAPSNIFAGVYVISWIIVGSFIFRNIFVGIMVNNFQSIRNDLFQEVLDITEQESSEKEVLEFAEELERQKDMRNKSTESMSHLLEQVKINATGQLPQRNALTGRRMSAVSTEGDRRNSSLVGGRRDSLMGGPRRDSLMGGPRRDSLMGGPRRDSLMGGPRRDSLMGGPRQDSLMGGPRRDSMMGRPRRDSLASQFSRQGRASISRGYGDDDGKFNQSEEDLQEAISKTMVAPDKADPDWQITLEKNLRNLAKEVARFCWPRDTIFRYLLIMESMHENLAERSELSRIIREVLVSFHDS